MHNTHIFEYRSDVRGHKQQWHFIRTHFFELQHDPEEFLVENNSSNTNEVTNNTT